MATVDYQPWYTGQTFASWQLPLNAGGVPDNITGVTISNFSMIFSNTTVRPAVDTTGTGTFTLMSSSPAVVLYKPSAADVASAFSGVLIVQAYFPPSNTNADEAVWDPIPFVITAR